MEYGEADQPGACNNSENVESRSAVNSLILDYYKKFGRKRDLEQYFSLSTAQSDIKDPSSTFWRSMKTQTESSDSGEGKSESSQELCRISIKCSVPEPSSSQVTTSHNLAALHPYLAKRLYKDEEPKSKTDSDSPPIITEDFAVECHQNSDDESAKSDDNNSQKSFDVLLDLSTNKPHSPSSSITSQRKLEWDSLADVGYGNESDRKNSASSLSTLERLALKQQYSNNDTKQDIDIGPPTAHSTPLEENDSKSKGKKGVKKSTKFYKKDVDVMEVNVPHTSNTNPSQAINVNLTKHISFSVEKGGQVTFENVKKDFSVSPDKDLVERENVTMNTVDKEMQTSLTKTKDKSDSSIQKPEPLPQISQRVPILISVNTLRKRNRRRKLRIVRRKPRSKKMVEKEKPPQEKSAEQLSEAESFEYMPGHIYNQNQLNANQSRSSNAAGNKSSLESSGVLTTDSSKDSKHSFTKDLEKGIEILKDALQQRYDDSHLRKKLVQELVQRLLKSKYRDDESTTEFLSGLSFSSKKLGLGEGNHTTSTSDANTTGEKPKLTRPKKSILRIDKFNPNAIASTSQSAPNLPSASNSEKPVTSNLKRTLISSNTESDISSKEKTSSDNANASSEVLYKKYLEALRREKSYAKHIRDKEMFFKQKLVSSDVVYKATARENAKTNNRLKDLIKDLTRNNYDDGSGDASKLEGGSNSNLYVENSNSFRNQRSHSVFTLSSGQSDCQNKKPNMKKRLQNDIKDMARPGSSKGHCCCAHCSPKPNVAVNDSSVQVNIKYDGSSLEHQRHPELVKCSDYERSQRVSPRNVAHIVCVNDKDDIKHSCLCSQKPVLRQENNDSVAYKGSHLTNRGIQLEETASKISTTIGVQCICPSHRSNEPSSPKVTEHDDMRREGCSADAQPEFGMTSKSSQTNMALKIICQKFCEKSTTSTSSSSDLQKSTKINKPNCVETNNKKKICEATRCIQTEISINPKISDPSLTDINIINDRDCVKLIGERNKVNSDLNDVNVSCIDRECENKNVVTNDNILNQGCAVMDDVNKEKTCANKHIQSNIEQTFSTIETQIRNMQHVENLADNYAIPIQGTNMTVMVSIGTKDTKKTFDTKNDEVVTQSVGTDIPSFSDQATSLLEECSKGVQSQNTEIFSAINKIVDTQNDIEQCNAEVLPPTKYSHTVEPPKTKFNHNTYPKIVLPSERKPLFRSNTDTGNLGNIQKSNLNKADLKTMITQLQTTKGTSTEELNKICVFCNCELINCICGKPKCYSEPLENTAHTNTGNLGNSRSIQTEIPDMEHINTQVNLAITQPQTTKKSTITNEQSKTSICNCGSITCSCGEQKCYSMTKEKISLNENLVTLSDDIRRKDMETQKNLSDDSPRNRNICSDNLKPKCGCPQPSECKGLCNNQCNGQDETEAKHQDLSKNNPKSKEIDRPNNHNSKDGNSLPKDPILEMIKDITQRYSKKDIETYKKKKCFKEIITLMNYLLDTDDTADNEDIVKSSSSSTPKVFSCTKTPKKVDISRDVTSPQNKKFVDKGIQMTLKKCKTNVRTESSDLPISTDIPSTSSDSATCRVLNRIRKECERFHQKRCKSSHGGGKNCEASSSTSVNCEKCRRVHHCPCRSHKCKGHKSKFTEKVQKKCVAYNLIIQTSDSGAIEETSMTKDKNLRRLQNIIVKVPSKRKVQDMPFNEVSAKIEKGFRCCDSQPGPRFNRSRSLPNDTEISSTDIFSKKTHCYTVRDYLERNRPDFVEKCSNRQDCLKFINQSRNQEPYTSPRLKMVVVHNPSCARSMGTSNIYCGGIPMCYNNPSDNPCDPYMHTIQSGVTKIGELANERAAHRDVLSLHLDRQPELTPTSDELRHLAQEIGVELRRKRDAPKFISEREMKKHSEKIYKSLSEVVQKKEDIKKENIKKTNLLMASIFKKNLQKKTLRGAVNLSNYSTVIKI